ncbi:hypothetical protein KC19_10G085700 [Ceratodon purpureus]|uniref:Beta-lactamase-related domain-containing protein n=1 Tax=Ceratodon purpureus TaxID=3225 RepID=A0A8T0GQB4_CERPU|nr:hypothetical protein KC19_10G085700 [Ceratodon purpureus]
MRGVGMRAVLIVKSFLCLWLMIASSAAQCPSAAFSPSDVLQNFDQNTVTDRLAEHIASLDEKVPALFQGYGIDVHAVTVVYGNTTIYSTGMVDTPFRIASVTKVFTAMGALVLRQQGRLALDDPVKKFLPNFSVINPYGKQHDITLRELMGHLSGLPRELCAGSIFCGPEDEEDILRFIARMQLVRPPWSVIPTYSNLGFAVLGHAWEKATSPRQSWSEFVRNAILNPLDMHDTGLDFANVKLAPGNLGPKYPSNTSIGWVGPTGDMYSTALDLAKFLKFLLKPDEKLLSETAIREWTKPTTLFPDTSDPTNIWNGFAMPWELVSLTTTDNQSTTLITKGGAVGTYLSIIALHPDSQLGVSVLTSSPNTTLGLNGVSYPSVISSAILQDLIPAVQSIHSKLISSLYSGVYTCKRSQDPMVSPSFANVTYQVLGGSINVTAMAPGKALVADWNITVLQNGVEAHLNYSASLVLKSAAEHSFWAYARSCSLISAGLSYDVEIARPNFPGSVYQSVFRFEPGMKVVRWPGIGAECYK